ncbi:response regulator [Halorussus halobius]|uniref:response regulator n=1 Tax=Halorussus halobius TaxID=1710537 RepID=UPI0010928CEB|nr:response regulator [Halorussus halobius]
MAGLGPGAGDATDGGWGTRVLLVDDDARVRGMYADWLEPTYDVAAVADGDDALDALDETFDVVLLDRRLREWSGSELLAELRRRGHDQSVVMVTGTEPDVDVVDLSIDEYLVKPIYESELREAVEFAARLSSYDGSLHEYFSLVSKLAALENSNVDGDLRATDAYADVEDRLAALETRLERDRRSLAETHSPQVFRKVLD